MATAHHLTAEELGRLPDNNERRELIEGQLRRLPFHGFEHGVVVANLALPLTDHVQRHHLGVTVATGTGFLLARNPDTVRGADIAFVSNARLPASGRTTGYFPGPPDLAVEIVSPHDTLQDVEDKVDDYLAAGARLVWVVNPRRRTVTIHRPQTPPTMLRERDTLNGDDVVRGFACPVAEIFA
jgi:Uma2 family endonuclease